MSLRTMSFLNHVLGKFMHLKTYSSANVTVLGNSWTFRKFFTGSCAQIQFLICDPFRNIMQPLVDDACLEAVQHWQQTWGFITWPWFLLCCFLCYLSLTGDLSASCSYRTPIPKFRAIYPSGTLIQMKLYLP